MTDSNHHELCKAQQMLPLDKIKFIIERISNRAGTAKDKQVLASLAESEIISIATGDKAVAIGGDATDAVIVTGDNNIVMTFKGTSAETVREAFAKLSPPREFQLRPVVRDFTGRVVELQKMFDAIQRDKTIISIHGMGGVGKSQLALKLAEQMKEDYPDGQIYLDMKGDSPKPISVFEAMRHVVRTFHPSSKFLEEEENESTLRGLYHTNLQHRQVILLLDNANKEQILPLITPPSCLLITTSRSQFVLPGSYRVHLKEMSPEDACNLLMKIEAEIGNHATAMAHLCAHYSGPLCQDTDGTIFKLDFSPFRLSSWLVVK